jgi:hypothetical protein
MTKKERLQNREKLAEAKNKNDVLEENNQWVKYKYLVKVPLPPRRQEGGKSQEKGVRRPKNNVNSKVLTEPIVNTTYLCCLA